MEITIIINYLITTLVVGLGIFTIFTILFKYKYSEEKKNVTK